MAKQMNNSNCICDAMVRMLVSIVDFKSWSHQTKDYKDGLAPIHVSDWSNMSTYGLLFQWASTIKIQLSVLV
jgi:hypothetical protein